VISPFGKVLKKRGVSAAKAADKIGVSRTSVYHWIAGNRGISLETLSFITRKLRLSNDEIGVIVRGEIKRKESEER